jgi:transcription-repair coupling factor (superfamily II helicase)
MNLLTPDRVPAVDRALKLQVQDLLPGKVYGAAGLPFSALLPAVAAWRLLHPKHPVVLATARAQEAEKCIEMAYSWNMEADYLVDDRPEDDRESISEAESWRILRKWSQKESNGILVTTSASLEVEWPTPDQLAGSFQLFHVGDDVPRESLILKLEEAGYIREAQAMEPGQMAVRGGIVDVFSTHAEDPIRLEFFGDEIESIRRYEPASQESIEEMEKAEIMLNAVEDGPGSGCRLLDGYLSNSPLVLSWDETSDADPLDWEIDIHDYLHHSSPDPVYEQNRRQLVIDHLGGWREEGWQIWLSCHNEGEAQRLREWLDEASPHEEQEDVQFLQSPLPQGFIWPSLKWVVLTDAEIFSRYQRMTRRQRKDRLAQWRMADRKSERFEEGDPVVHLEYGVGLFRGMKELPGGAEAVREVMELEYAGGGKLYVPLDQAYLVTRYVGARKLNPPLDTLGNSRWSKKTAEARVAVMDYAARLIRIQAERESLQGFPFPPDHPWQEEFESAFIYEPTVDQERAVRECKEDMERARPMDRLICGDVGFGKTEVAIRAAFKAVMAGKQVAFLAPTTVLAQQHFETLRERMADYPVCIEVLSRFVSAAEQRRVIRSVREGVVDIVIGTHRLLSPDIEFKDLGLVVVDEEQRFGVEQKEQLKDRYRMIDMLSLSATPIPRTLYFALMGARDMSTIDTPPANRRPVETKVAPYDERLIRTSIQRELQRGGQVYFLHNRVHSIQKIAKRIKFLIPEARVDIGHGQMPESELEGVMRRFLNGQMDVLVSTTIIESGIDIPNANTIIIDRADRFGLADLYQLRGRVGRSSTRAHAILLVPRDLLGGDAGKRVRTMKQYTQLGSGFKVAMRDLEIRGAGNLLGREQSGHITAIGFEFYCRLLRQAVASLQGKRDASLREIRLYFDFVSLGEREEVGQEAAYIPPSYIPDTAMRIDAYRRLAELESIAEWDKLGASWRDQFGPWPSPVCLLLEYQKIRIAGLAGHITQIDVKDSKLMMKRNDDYIMISGKFPRLKESEAKARLHEIQRWISSLA